MKRPVNNSRGSGILELVLFVPLGLMFLFAAVDCGFALLDRASIRDALRAGMHSQLLHSRNNGEAMIFDDNYAPDVDEARLNGLIESVADRVFSNIADTRGEDELKLVQEVRVEIAAVKVFVDEQTGKVTGWAALHEAAPPSRRGAFELLSAAPNYRYRSADQFIADSLRGSAALGVRKPSGNFYPFSIALYGEVNCLARGLHPAAVHGLLSGYFAIQEQNLFALRGGAAS